jgi:lysyl-tRNA synthetase class 1
MSASTTHTVRRHVSNRSRNSGFLASLKFSDVERRAERWADYIEAHFEELAEMLLEYESYEVVQDEVGRTLDHLRNLKENKKYFRLRIGAVTTFLPRNQPLYALTCFVIIPSLMATEVHFRIPNSMRRFFPKVLELLNIKSFFPNVVVSTRERSDFLRHRSSLLVDPKTLESVPITDVVIFTGTSVHADQLRFIFDAKTLFIANGAGHNPIIVSEDADIAKAVEATLTLQLYNQGQDCAAPNAILVHQSVFQDFLNLLHSELHRVQIGRYRDRSCRVGPISEPKDLVRIQDFLIEHQTWLDPEAPGIIRSRDAILEPTIINKPLVEGGNFTEIFAPVVFVQKYENDHALSLYFENPHYARNAMYVSLYGTSTYVQSLVGKRVEGKKIHDYASILHNTHLHAPGVERGTQQYGGYGYGASSLSINGKIIPKPTLPQREMYERVARRFLNKKSRKKHLTNLKRFTERSEKDIQKLMKLKLPAEPENQYPPKTDMVYVDLHAIEKGNRYTKVGPDALYQLLEQPNLTYVSGLGPRDLKLVRAVRSFLRRRKKITVGDFATWLYSLPKEPDADDDKNRAHQLRFFGNLYQLLLGEKSGPRLAPFLLDIDRKRACELLDV